MNLNFINRIVLRSDEANSHLFYTFMYDDYDIFGEVKILMPTRIFSVTLPK